MTGLPPHPVVKGGGTKNDGGGAGGVVAGGEGVFGFCTKMVLRHTRGEEAPPPPPPGVVVCANPRTNLDTESASLGDVGRSRTRPRACVVALAKTSRLDAT